MPRLLLFFTLIIAIGIAPVATAQDIQTEADEFLRLYSSMYQGLSTLLSEAWWDASTDVSPQHDGERTAAGKAYATFAGDPVIIERLRYFRQFHDVLDPVTVRQLEKAWFEAADSPGTVPELVGARVEAEGAQSSTWTATSSVCVATPTAPAPRCSPPTTSTIVW